MEFATLLFALVFLAWLSQRGERNALVGDQPCHSCGETIHWDNRRKTFVHKATRLRFHPPIPGDDLHNWSPLTDLKAPIPHPATPWWN